VLAALREKLGGNVNVTSSIDGSGTEGADLILAVVGEMPYAEGAGDDDDLKLPEGDLTMLAKVSESNIPTVVVLYSGRPLDISDVIGQADAFVAAWLPGTEGAGIVDVLLGDYSPTGKLSFTWPKSAAQEPINVGDEEYDPLFPFGYGLTYDK
jgi:beta-glucosidase